LAPALRVRHFRAPGAIEGHCCPDYQSRRGDFVDGFMGMADWEFADKNFGAAGTMAGLG